MSFFIIGFYGEKLDPRKRNVFVIKDHFGELTKKYRNYDTVIFIIRNPYNAIRSDFNRQKTNSHTNHIEDKILLTEGNKDKHDSK